MGEDTGLVAWSGDSLLGAVASAPSAARDHTRKSSHKRDTVDRIVTDAVRVVFLFRGSRVRVVFVSSRIVKDR